jgi:hypothetical protein
MYKYIQIAMFFVLNRTTMRLGIYLYAIIM